MSQEEREPSREWERMQQAIQDGEHDGGAWWAYAMGEDS